jgi:hypothetical protein
VGVRLSCCFSTLPLDSLVDTRVFRLGNPGGAGTAPALLALLRRRLLPLDLRLPLTLSPSPSPCSPVPWSLPP